MRESADEKLFCAFNMTDTAIDYQLEAGPVPTDINAPGSLSVDASGLLSLTPFGAYIGTMR